jgi:hypothetical protein
MIVVQASLGKKQDPSSKITKAKRAGGIAQAVERLSNKCEVLSSNPSITKKREGKEEEKQNQQNLYIYISRDKSQNHHVE